MPYVAENYQSQRGVKFLNFTFKQVTHFNSSTLQLLIRLQLPFG